MYWERVGIHGDLTLLSTSMKRVITNGCFDVIHAGHVHLLQQARALGEHLTVGLNSDRSITALKGDGRPINCYRDRAAVLAAFDCVDEIVCVDSTDMIDFILDQNADVWVKGGDYTLATLNQDEVNAAKTVGSRIVIIPPLEGRSTTSMLSRCMIQNEFKHSDEDVERA